MMAKHVRINNRNDFVKNTKKLEKIIARMDCYNSDATIGILAERIRRLAIGEEVVQND